MMMIIVMGDGDTGGGKISPIFLENVVSLSLSDFSFAKTPTSTSTPIPDLTHSVQKNRPKQAQTPKKDSRDPASEKKKYNSPNQIPKARKREKKINLQIFNQIFCRRTKKKRNAV